ncbi:UNVERIFIED_ORG: hypothetical protein ABIC48_006868 [Burkholderia territorii]
MLAGKLSRTVPGGLWASPREEPGASQNTHLIHEMHPIR